MHSLYISSAFSDIKTELRTRVQIEKELTELRLWFTFYDEVLYVHDFDDHNKNIIIGIFKPTIQHWIVNLKAGTHGKQLVEETCQKCSSEKLAEKLNDLYESHGFGRLR